MLLISLEAVTLFKNYISFQFKLITKLSMFSVFFISLALCNVVTSSISYAATLTYSDNLIIREVDDKPVDHGLFSKQSSFELNQGVHTLVVKYKDVFEDIEFAEERVVKSDYFVVKFTVEAHKSLLLTTIDIVDLAAAERFVKSPVIKIVADDQQELVLELETLSDYELAKQVTKVVTNISPSQQKHSNLEPGDIAVNRLNNSEDNFDNTVMKEVDALPMLKYWWAKTNKAQRQSFLNFVEQEQNK